MDSNTLIELGFHEWLRVKVGVEKQAPQSKGVYAFRAPVPVKSERGSSDIMYIGRAMSERAGSYHNIRQSLREYLHPGHSRRPQRTKIRVGQKALEGGWEISWMLTDSPDKTECELLRRFYREHSQLPPENIRWPPGCKPLDEY